MINTFAGVVMPPTIQELGIDQLSIEDRLALVHDLWDSIAEIAVHLALTEKQKQIFDQ